MPPSGVPAGFVTIGSGIYISLTPVNAKASKSDDAAPNVILIFGWMGALTTHLQKYSRKYVELYPQATQIIVECKPSAFWISERAQHSRLLPVVEVLKALDCLPSESINHSARDSSCIGPRVLVHSFSNGGGLQLTSLSRLLSSEYPAISPMKRPTGAFILDSAPAIGNYRSIGMAFTIAIRNPIARYIVLAIVYVIHTFRLCLQIGFGVETRLSRYIKALHNPHLFPWMNTQTPRLYVFSKKDQLVPWKEVQQHADAARLMDLDVHCEIYEESDHVAHMRIDPKRYWSSIQDLWKIACLESEAKDV